MTLVELKALNAAEDEKALELNEEPAETEPETEEPIEVEVTDEAVEDEQDESEDTDESENDSEESEELEEWQKGDSGKTGFVPNAAAKTLRLKAKALKADLKESNTELEELRRKVEQLSQPKPQEPTVSTRPKLEDFDYDEDLHNNALDQWYEAKIDSKLQSTQQANNQEHQASLAQEQLNVSVNAHYEKAADLINSGKVTEEAYQSGEKAIRNMLDQVIPGRGEVIADQLIGHLHNSGEGSEKVWFHLGNNSAALSGLKDSLTRDPSGIQAGIYLGQLQLKTIKPTRKRSSAPKPAAKLKGDSKKMSSFKKQYDKSEDVSERIRLKRAAKDRGESTINW